MISFWLRGDGSAHRLRVSLSGKGFVYRSEGSLPITFEGWKEVYCFLRPEAFDPVGQPLLQLHRQSGSDEPVPVAAIEGITFHLDAVSRPGQIWYRLTDSFRLAWALDAVRPLLPQQPLRRHRRDHRPDAHQFAGGVRVRPPGVPRPRYSCSCRTWRR